MYKYILINLISNEIAHYFNSTKVKWFRVLSCCTIKLPANKVASELHAQAHRRHKNVADHLQAVPLGHSARQGDLEEEVALQDLPHAIEGHLELPVAQQPGLDLGQGLLVLLRQQRREEAAARHKTRRKPPEWTEWRPHALTSKILFSASR